MISIPSSRTSQQTSRIQLTRFLVILNKANIVLQRIDAQSSKTAKVRILGCYAGDDFADHLYEIDNLLVKTVLDFPHSVHLLGDRRLYIGRIQGSGPIARRKKYRDSSLSRPFHSIS